MATVPDEFQELSINVPSQPGAAAISASVKRITVLLGANGSGKSRTLRWLAQHFRDATNTIYIEGGRTVSLDERETPQEQIKFQSSDAVDKYYVQHKKISLTKRLRALFKVIRRRMELRRIDHSRAVGAWQASGGTGVCPRLEELPDEKLVRLFNEAFSEVNLESDGGKFRCRRGTTTYAVKDLSDGERQSLALIADIAVLSEHSSLVLVDEPELNLNALLACRLWEIIERERTDLRFIYATHLLSFVIRPTVETAITLGGPSRVPTVLNDVASIDPDELKPFLGTIPAIVSSSQTLLVEGHANSIDTALYRWILGTRDLVIVPFQDCQQIVSAVRAEGVWRRIAAAVKIAGVIDRDFRSDEQLASFARDKISILDLHEIESYLCIPTAVMHVAEAIDASVTINQILDLIRRNAEGSIVRVSLLRAIERLRVLVSPALDSGVLRSVSSIEQAKVLMKNALDSQITRLQAMPSPAQVLDEEFARCRRAVDSNDAIQMLRLFEGKAVFHQVPRLVGFDASGSYLSAFLKFVRLESIPELVRLRDAAVHLLQ